MRAVFSETGEVKCNQKRVVERGRPLLVCDLIEILPQRFYGVRQDLCWMKMGSSELLDESFRY